MKVLVGCMVSGHGRLTEFMYLERTAARALLDKGQSVVVPVRKRVYTGGRVRDCAPCTLVLFDDSPPPQPTIWP